jgi:hypothetical protein
VTSHVTCTTKIPLNCNGTEAFLQVKAGAQVLHPAGSAAVMTTDQRAVPMGRAALIHKFRQLPLQYWYCNGS